MRLTQSAYLHNLQGQADKSSDPEWLAHFELLVRSILVRPDQPAVIILGHFALRSKRKMVLPVPSYYILWWLNSTTCPISGQFHNF